MDRALALYILLNSRIKWASFGYTLQAKNSVFLSKNVHALWIFFRLSHTLTNEALGPINFEHLFHALKNLKKLGLTPSFFGVLLKLTSPSFISTRLHSFSWHIVCVDHLSLRTVHVIDPIIDPNTSRKERDALAIWKNPQEYFKRIPQIYFEFTSRTASHPVLFVRTLGILLAGAKTDSSYAAGYHSTFAWISLAPD